MTLDAKIESILFWKAEPVSVKKLMKIFLVSEAEVREALARLHEKIKDRGVRLIFKDDEVTLRTVPELSDVITALAKEELAQDLGKAGLETLSVVLYQGPISRRDIDYIRGVNSTFILRNLSVRGLVERIPNPKDERSFLYRPTFDLLSFLGLSHLEDLPEYSSVRHDIEIIKIRETEAVGDSAHSGSTSPPLI